MNQSDFNKRVDAAIATICRIYDAKEILSVTKYDLVTIFKAMKIPEPPEYDSGDGIPYYCPDCDKKFFTHNGSISCPYCLRICSQKSPKETSGYSTETPKETVTKGVYATDMNTNSEPKFWLEIAKAYLLKDKPYEATRCINEAIELIYGKELDAKDL